ncbi:AIR synthase related protein [Desulfosporosinus metallidurans]|uniref:Putative alpha-ribazole-5-phosphate synthase CblS for cobalamin biosynthesis n=1 Tax=Desulfosporosinus metallidurans TaxID=1888891 RepID=A0A1Q8QPX1_9FIRM|nr:alpha-ribazole kinase [Desulfosporosinus metallidurans]OLN29399.1 putative alpha-ribazole-5-phosphate synthase CblS for cobalamin biosynthesis [Desulfosporosinus metallidurans]
MGYLGRDVEVVAINTEQLLVASCDSCGAIGMKDLDELQISWSITGRLTTRVALLEVLATGAVPLMMTVAISNEPYPTGEGILEGVKEEFAAAGLTLPMAISTEKNMNTQQTGLGISVIGVAKKNRLRIGTSLSGDDVYCLGLPKVGPEVSNPEDPEIVQANHIRVLLDSLGVHDIIPVGSRGIRTEAQLLASNSNSRLIVDPTCLLDLDKSAGPSTCVIFTSSSPLSFDLTSSGFKRLPVTRIGKLN